MTATNLSLFDVEDADETPKVRNMVITPISTGEVTEFCQRYHYTNTGGNMTWRYGLWHGPIVYGVIAYNLPTREVCESVFGPDHYDKVWHMGRLALAETSPRNSESRLIAGSLKLIERDHRNIWAVVTYAATDAGHIGYVYQATNALYTGQFGEPHHFVDQRGVMRSTVQQGHRVSLESAAAMGWVRKPSGPKHRYLYILGDRRQRRQRRQLLRWTTLPYPKAG